MSTARVRRYPGSRPSQTPRASAEPARRHSFMTTAAALPFKDESESKGDRAMAVPARRIKDSFAATDPRCD
jgi:hypothetical protein